MVFALQHEFQHFRHLTHNADTADTSRRGLVLVRCIVAGRSRIRGRVIAGLNIVLPVLPGYYRTAHHES